MFFQNLACLFSTKLKFKYKWTTINLLADIYTALHEAKFIPEERKLRLKEVLESIDFTHFCSKTTLLFPDQRIKIVLNNAIINNKVKLLKITFFTFIPLETWVNEKEWDTSTLDQKETVNILLHLINSTCP